MNSVPPSSLPGLHSVGRDVGLASWGGVWILGSRGSLRTEGGRRLLEEGLEAVLLTLLGETEREVRFVQPHSGPLTPATLRLHCLEPFYVEAGCTPWAHVPMRCPTPHAVYPSGVGTNPKAAWGRGAHTPSPGECRTFFFPFDLFSQLPSRSSGTLPLPHLDLALGLGTRGLPPGDSSKLHPSWDGLTQQLQ